MKTISYLIALMLVCSCSKQASTPASSTNIYEDNDVAIASCTVTKNNWQSPTNYWGFLVTVTGTVKKTTLPGISLNTFYKSQGAGAQYFGNGTFSYTGTTTDTTSRSTLHIYYQSSSTSSQVDIPITWK